MESQNLKRTELILPDRSGLGIGNPNAAAMRPMAAWILGEEEKFPPGSPRKFQQFVGHLRIITQHQRARRKLSCTDRKLLSGRCALQ